MLTACVAARKLTKSADSNRPLMEHLIPIPVGSYNILILVGAKFFFGCRGFTDVQFSLHDESSWLRVRDGSRNRPVTAA
jgi:hypothetical protein